MQALRTDGGVRLGSWRRVSAPSRPPRLSHALTTVAACDRSQHAPAHYTELAPVEHAPLPVIWCELYLMKELAPLDDWLMFSSGSAPQRPADLHGNRIVEKPRGSCSCLRRRASSRPAARVPRAHRPRGASRTTMVTELTCARTRWIRHSDGSGGLNHPVPQMIPSVLKIWLDAPSCKHPLMPECQYRCGGLEVGIVVNNGPVRSASARH
jgi:hypothetical protein